MPTGLSNKGFTLLELMVVLVIVGLAISLVPALLSGVGLTTEVRGAARQLAAGLRSARNVAVSSQQGAVLTLDLEERVFRVSGNPRAISLPDDEGVAIKLYTVQTELSDEMIGNIRFFPDGSSTGGHISLIDRQVEYKVSVDWLTGRVGIEELEVR